MTKHYGVMNAKDPEWQMIARKKGAGLLPKSEWDSQYMEINLCTNNACPMNLISAIATQPDPEQLSWVSRFKVSYNEGNCTSNLVNGRCEGRSWKPTDKWVFYSKSGQKGGNFVQHGDVLVGAYPEQMDQELRHVQQVSHKDWRQWKPTRWTTDLASNLIWKTMLDAPFRARFVRIHPVCWHGPSMAMRVELYAKSTPFDWSLLKKHPTLECGNENEPGTILYAASGAFAAWTDGLDGGGGTYESGTTIVVDGNKYQFKAYQRRTFWMM